MALNTILIILASFILFDSLEKRKLRLSIEKLEKNIVEKIISSLNGVQVTNIPDNKSLYLYLTERAKGTVKHWDILTFSPYKQNCEQWKEKIDYQEVLYKAVKERNLIIRRLLTIWDECHLNHLIERMKDYQDQKYFVSGFSKNEKMIPMLNMIIIDRKEVILWLLYERGFVGWGVGGIAINHPNVAETFYQYYSEIWNNNKDNILKDENSIHEDNIEKIRKKL